MKNRSVVILDLNDPRRTPAEATGGQSRDLTMLVQALEKRTISVALGRTASEAITLITFVRPDLLLIDPSIANGFTVVDYAKAHGVEVIAMTDSDVVLNRARLRGINQTVIKGDGWDNVMDAVLRFFGEDVPVETRNPAARILVADASHDTIDLVSKFLNSRGFSVASASTGLECMQILDTDPTVEVVILDIILPEMGGLEVLERLSRWQAPPNVIVASAINDREIARSAWRLGVFDFMPKPINLSALETNIVACVAYSEYKAQPWWKRVIGGSPRGV
jgi:CheY-like chemotaxis protein